MMKVKIVCAITMLAAVPAAAETKSPPIRQALVHEYARKQLPLARAEGKGGMDEIAIDIVESESLATRLEGGFDPLSRFRHPTIARAPCTPLYKQVTSAAEAGPLATRAEPSGRPRRSIRPSA
jgi:hypothetical protein